MHPIQQKILGLTKTQDIGKLTLREIAELIGEKFPQTIKHHRDQLVKKGLLMMDSKTNSYKEVKIGASKIDDFYYIPILGNANCGDPVSFADEYYEGTFTISKSALKIKKQGLFILKAVGDSMNQANIDGTNIENGDYVLVDSTDKQPENNKYILSIINGCANIKKMHIEKELDRFLLLSESSNDYPPIVIHESDMDDYMINGKVVQVIKAPRF